ncbi:MAG TPA: hypothetical protein VHN14_31370 [Kofleriaceae bacterium]|jgi:hypothetical protein|nr:hypothetical protein [Kofleriaceae bacterium]
MRWFLPLVFALALAVRTADHVRVYRRKCGREALEGSAWTHPDVGEIGPTVTEASAWQLATVQRATFDAKAGTLTWFDDENYN